MSSDVAPLLGGANNRAAASQQGAGGEENDTDYRIVACVKTVFNHPMFPFVSGGLALGGMTVAAVFFDAPLVDFTTHCLYELNHLTGNLTECQAPFEAGLDGLSWVMYISAFVLGILAQMIWETPVDSLEEESEQVVAAASISKTDRFVQQAREKIAWFQRQFTYEIHLGIGYLYNGLWYDVSSQSSWHRYFRCQVAAICTAFASLGMYTRVKWLHFLREYNTVEPHVAASKCERTARRVLYVVYGIAGVSCIAVSASHITHGSVGSFTFNEFMSRLGALLLVRPFAEAFTRFVNRRRNAEIELISSGGTPRSCCPRFFSNLSHCLELQSVQVVIGYFLFLRTTDEASQVAGLVFMGFAMGAKDAFYKPLPKQSVREIATRNRECETLWKVGKFFWDYKWTMGLITLLATDAHFNYLKCYNYARANCPLGFEITNNYVNIDGAGLNIVVITGLVTYYARSLLKWIGKKYKGDVQTVCEFPVEILNKYQFDMLTVIPFVISISGKRLTYFHAYESLNPPIVLGLIGATFATYKERVDDHDEDPFKPSMSHIAALLGAVHN